MATIVAAASGNWSNPATWVGGNLPTFGDFADCAGFTVTIDQDVDLGADGRLIATQSGAGGFVVSAAPRSIVANIVATVRLVLTCSHASGTVTVTGDVNGGTTASQHGILLNGAGVLEVIGNAAANDAINGGSGIRNDATGTVNLTGNAIGGGSNANGITNATTGIVNVNGNATGGVTGGHGIRHLAAGQAFVTGYAKGGVGGSSGVLNSTTGIVTVGKAIGNDFGPGGVTAQGPGITNAGTSTGRAYAYALEYGPFGMAPVVGHVRMIEDVLNSVRIPDANLDPLLLGTAMSIPDFAHASNVRQGVIYAGDQVGTLAVPNPAQVALGVPTDHTVGTALFSAADAAAAILDAATADHVLAGSIGEAIGSGGGGGGGEAPTVEQIWAAPERTLTGYGTLVADVATAVWAATERTLTGFGSLVADVATAVWAAATRTITAGGITPGEIWTHEERTLTSAESNAPTVEEIWAAPDRSLTSASGGGGATAEDVWTYAPRTLTQSGAEVIAAVSGSDLGIVRGVTFAATLTGITMPAGWATAIFTVKHVPTVLDSTAAIQIVKSNPGAAEDGLRYVAALPASNPEWGALVIGATSIAIAVADDATHLLTAGAFSYDVKVLLSDGTSQLLAEGQVSIRLTETETLGQVG